MATGKLVKQLIGDRSKLDYDRYFMTLICLTASVFLLCLCVFHIIMGLSFVPVILAGSSSLVLFGLYLLVRFGTCLFIPKIIVTILGILLLDLTWYYKFLSLGPVLFFIFAFGALIVWIWEERFLIFMLIFYFANILALFLIEYNHPDFHLEYESLKIRTADIYLSFFLYSVLLIFILWRVKHDFRIEKEKAIKSDKLKTAFLANLSHEIRTPMNAIVGFSNLIEQNPDKKYVKKYISNIKSSSDNLLRLINEILDLSKIEAGYSQVRTSDFYLRNLFEELKDIFLIEIKNRDKTDISLDYDLPVEDNAINSDYTILSQILSILLNNAIKFSNKGKIRYSYDILSNEVLFNVRDEGYGIPTERKELVFDRFTKFDYEGVNTEGSGIGLSIAKKLVDLLGGRIWVNSNPDKGTTFSFTVPYVKAIKPEDKNKTEIKDIVPNKSNAMQTTKDRPILIVEDDKSSYLLIREILNHLNVPLERVGDGGDAISFVKDNPSTAIILMDLKLPFMDGYEATKEIKKLYPNIFIIAQTAYAMQGDREKAIQAGCDEYLTKPIDADELQQLVKKFMNMVSTPLN